jgi:hypothetical protein
MKQIAYGFFGEDEPQKLFLENYLRQLPSYLERPEIMFYANEEFLYSLGSGSNNRDRVDGFFVEAGVRGFLQHSLDLYFVGRDCDHHDDADCRKKRQEMELKIISQWQNKTIILVPVQCIEHWLLYLKRRQSNPVSTKNETLELIPRDKAKLELYNRKRFSPEHDRSMVKDLTKSIYIHWFESRCESFRAFHQKTVASVTQFLA